MWKLLFSLAACTLALHSYAQEYPPIVNCFNALRYDPSLNLIAAKVGLGSHADQTFALMANESYPTESEKAVILEYGNKRQRCLNDSPQNQHPSSLAYVQAQRSLQMLLLKLYGGHMTYGDFIRQKEALSNSHQASQTEISNQLQQQNSQNRQQRNQYCQNNYQQCLNRASDIFMRNTCQLENAGCTTANSLTR